MLRSRSLVAVIAGIALIASCGAQPSSGDSMPPSNATDALPPVPTAVARADGAAPSSPSIRTVPAPEAPNPEAPTVGENLGEGNPLPRAQTVQLDQPAIWPASDIVFATPEEAAASFVSNVLGVEPVLGDFLGGDSRSGEIQVFSPGEVEGAELLERGLLGLRIIGPNDGWFVIAATSAGVSIESPETLDRVDAGPLTVTGQGRGFEGTVVVSAIRAGDADAVVDQVITRGGVFESLEPFSVTLDLSSGAPDEVIALIVRGDTGLDGDPGDFASLPVVIRDQLPATR